MDYSKFNFPDYVYHEYPKYVGSVIVQNAAEEGALLGKEDDEPERTKRPYNRKDK